jgi:hypothetical protein
VFGGEEVDAIAFEFSLKDRQALSTGTTMRGQNRVKISLLLE